MGLRAGHALQAQVGTLRSGSPRKPAVKDSAAKCGRRMADLLHIDCETSPNPVEPQFSTWIDRFEVFPVRIREGYASKT